MLKRHEIQVLRRAGHSQIEAAKLAGVSLGSVRRVEREPDVTQIDSGPERERRGIGRPAKAEPFRALVAQLLAQEPELLSVEILRRTKLAGYTGGKTALYDLVTALRPTTVRPLVRFEGLPGEFSQHDFGQVEVRFLEGTRKRVHFFASRLKYSRWVEVTVVPDECAETLVRALVDHFAAIGGIPLLAVFDRPTTIALKWTKDGQVTEWNALFAGVALDLGLGIELCWPARPEQKGSIENLIGWVKGSFFKQRRFRRHQPVLHLVRLRRADVVLGVVRRRHRRHAAQHVPHGDGLLGDHESPARGASTRCLGRQHRADGQPRDSGGRADAAGHRGWPRRVRPCGPGVWRRLWSGLAIVCDVVMGSIPIGTSRSGLWRHPCRLRYRDRRRLGYDRVDGASPRIPTGIRAGCSRGCSCPAVLPGCPPPTPPGRIGALRREYGMPGWDSPALPSTVRATFDHPR